MQLEIERTALEQGEGRRLGKARREAIERELAELRERGRRDEGAVAGREGRRSSAVPDAQGAARAGATREAERAEREATSQRAAELRYGEIPELERALAEAEAALGRADDAGFLKEEVTGRTSPRSSRAGPASP